jgi:hypothetical protein
MISLPDMSVVDSSGEGRFAMEFGGRNKTKAKRSSENPNLFLNTITLV